MWMVILICIPIKKNVVYLLRADHSDDDDDDSNSQITLSNLSVVELNVSEDELAALSDVDSKEDDDDENDNINDTEGNKNNPPRTVRRPSRRLRDKRETSNDAMVQPNRILQQYDDAGRLDLTNIITGKRKRFPIDYRKLNDHMFHAVPASELDDEDEFVYTDPPYPHSTTTNTKVLTRATRTTKQSTLPTTTTRKKYPALKVASKRLR